MFCQLTVLLSPYGFWSIVNLPKASFFWLKRFCIETTFKTNITITGPKGFLNVMHYAIFDLSTTDQTQIFHNKFPQ